MADAFPFDPEHAYRRCVELMDKLDAEAKEKLSGRQLAMHGTWRRPRKWMESFMYVRLFDCTLRGVTLDEVILNELDALCNVPAFRAVDAPPARRLAAFNRQPLDELPQVFTADGAAPIRNESPEVGANDGDDLLGRW